jgi:hypothetical protein
MPPDTPSNVEIAAQWRTTCISPYVWRPDGDQHGVKTGEAGGYRVVADGFPRRGYLKPANAHGDEAVHARAAREKIASDLAFDLNLKVPPAVLTSREQPPAGCTPYVVVSLIMYPQQWTWSEVRGLAIEQSPLGAAMAGALARCTSLLAFDTWLGQTDHGDHPDNVIWGYNPTRLGESAIIFLDYANSMGFNGEWANDGWQNVAAAPWPPRMLDHIAPAELQQTVERIEGFSQDAIREVVNRIPDPFLAAEHKTAITAGLIGRRALVAGALHASLKV